MAWLLRLLIHTPLGRLCVSDHAMHAQEEMRCLDRGFQALRTDGLPMPAWDALRREALHILQPAHHHHHHGCRPCPPPCGEFTTCQQEAKRC